MLLSQLFLTQVRCFSYRNRGFVIKFPIIKKYLSIANMTESPYFTRDIHLTRYRLKKEPVDAKPCVAETDTSNSSKPASKLKVSRLNSKKRTLKIHDVPKVKVEIKYEDEEGSFGTQEVKKEIPKWEPAMWREQLRFIYQMRSRRDAPVDSMGCDVISDEKASPEVYRYQVLLSLMLSSQTKDQITSAAMSKLRQHGCNIPNILKTPDSKLGELIYPVGFWKRKVEYIKKTSKILQDDYNNDIPDTVEKLCKLPGVGPKMAYLVMKCAWNQVLGIGVDTHVHRISNRLGWVKKPTKQPEETRLALEDWLPRMAQTMNFDGPIVEDIRENWEDINHLLVGFGQQTCLPVGPKCSECLNNAICPFGKSQLRHSPGKKIKVEK